MEKFFSVQNMNIAQYIACINSWLSENNIIPERISVGEFLGDDCKNKKASPEINLIYSEGDVPHRTYALSYSEKISFIKSGLDDMLSDWRRKYPDAKVKLCSNLHGTHPDSSECDGELSAPDCNRLWVLYEKTEGMNVQDVISDRADKETDETCERRYCPECGTPTVKEALFCAECGTKLEF